MSKRRRRVMFYYEFLGFGGVETMLVNRLQALAGRAIAGDFWFSQFYGDGARYLADSESIRMVEKHVVAALAAEQSFDCIVVIDNPQVLRDVLESRSTAEVFFETHASFLPDLKHFYAEADNPALKGIIVPSEYNKTLLSTNVAVSPERITVVNNVVDAAHFSAAPITTLPAPTVLWVGRLEDEKNPHDLIRVAQILLSRTSKLQFVVIGDAPDYHKYLRQLEADVGAPPANISFVRAVPYSQMGSYYRSAGDNGGALLSTSHFESSPMIILEAMLFGCPVVSSAVGGVPLMVQHGVNGLLYPPGAVDVAANLLDEITSSPPLRRRITDGGYRYVSHSHSAATAAADFEALLVEVRS